MHNLMHHDVVSQVARDRSNRLIREADAHRLARAARTGTPPREHRPSLADLFARVGAVRRLAEIRN